MSVVSGRVTLGPTGLAGLLVEVFHTKRDFAEDLPLSDRAALAAMRLRRLGSARTDAAGNFQIEHAGTPPNALESKPPDDINLWLAVSGCDTESGCEELIYQAPDIRFCAAETETYVICLPASLHDMLTAKPKADDVSAPDQIHLDAKQREGIATARAEVFAKAEAQRVVRKEAFAKDVRPELIRRMSLVERDAKGKPVDANFVDDPAKLRLHAETRLSERIKKDLSKDVPRDKRLSLSGRIALTPAQLKSLMEKKIVEDSDDGSFAVDEDDLQTILKKDDVTGLNPESDEQIVNRIDALKRFCRDVTEDDTCLMEEEDQDDDEDDDGERDGGAPDVDDGDGAGA